MRTDEGIEICADGSKADEPKELRHSGVNGLYKEIESGKLFIDPRDLIGDPESFTEWCYYSYAPTFKDTGGMTGQALPPVLSSDEVRTIEALMRFAGLPLPSDGSSLLKQCFLADLKISAEILASGGELKLQNKGIYSVKPLASFEGVLALDLTQNSVTDPTPLARLKKLKSLILDRNKLKSLSGLEIIKPEGESYLSVAGNHIASGLEKMLNDPAFTWKSVRFGKNPQTRINNPVKPSHVKKLDLIGAVVTHASGLASIEELDRFELMACVSQIPVCPFQESTQRKCSLQATATCQ
jgi:hypothetical protein